jgi:hypothetical protein
MNVILYTSPYAEKNPERRAELENCFEKNLEAGFLHINLLVEQKDLDYLYNGLYYGRMVDYDHRPAFQDYIDVANIWDTEAIVDKDYEGDLHVVCNSDIYLLPETLEKLKGLQWEKDGRKLFVALSRYDLTSDGSLVLLDRWDTADTWVWKGKCPVQGIQCPCGYPGVDNHIAWKFKEAGYHVVNPSRDIVTVHQHLVQINNYRQTGHSSSPVKADQICPEPYAFHTPIHIDQIWWNY